MSNTELVYKKELSESETREAIDRGRIYIRPPADVDTIRVTLADLDGDSDEEE